MFSGYSRSLTVAARGTRQIGASSAEVPAGPNQGRTGRLTSAARPQGFFCRDWATGCERQAELKTSQFATTAAAAEPRPIESGTTPNPSGDRFSDCTQSAWLLWLRHRLSDAGCWISWSLGNVRGGVWVSSFAPHPRPLSPRRERGDRGCFSPGLGELQGQWPSPRGSSRPHSGTPVFRLSPVSCGSRHVPNSRSQQLSTEA